MEDKKIRMHIYEEILCIILDLNLPLQLKGSYAYAQYFECPEERLLLAEDLDFVYIGNRGDYSQEEICSRIIKQILDELFKRKIEFADANVYYEKDEYDCYIYHVDYEMEDDFVTMGIEFGNVNIFSLNIEITFGLPQWIKPVSLEYKALTREPFILKYVTLPEVQIGWKFHQCLVRTRIKDLIDISYLIQKLNWKKSKLLYNMLCTTVGDCICSNICSESRFLFDNSLIYKFENLLNGDIQSLTIDFSTYENKLELLKYKSFILDSDLKDNIETIFLSNSDVFLKYFFKTISNNLNIKYCIHFIDKITSPKYIYNFFNPIYQIET